MMIINDMMIIDEVRNKNKIINPTNLRPSSIKGTKATNFWFYACKQPVYDYEMISSLETGLPAFNLKLSPQTPYLAVTYVRLICYLANLRPLTLVSSIRRLTYVRRVTTDEQQPRSHDLF